MMNIENMILSGRSQPQKNTCCRIPLNEMSRIGKSIVDGWLSRAGLVGEVGGGGTANGYGVSFGE